MGSPRAVSGVVAGAIAAILLTGAPTAQGPAPAASLREAAPDEIWITRPDLAGEAPRPAPAPRSQIAAAADVTPPTDPGNFHAFTSGLFRIAASWSPSVDPESGIDSYAFAIGTGTTTDTEADVRWWQSAGTGTRASVNMALTPGAVYHISVRATNGANLSSAVVRSPPLTAAGLTYGAESNQMDYSFGAEGFTDTGAPMEGWSPQQQAAFGGFLEQMVPLLKEIYGPPSTSYRVLLVRDLRYTQSAIFIPSTEEIHMGDNVTYQLLTHEMIHAFRRDRLLSSGPLWEYDNTLSGFEEGFAQAMSYRAMTEFARRYPTFGLAQKIYQSSNEWDYDFQNVPELGTTDFWSDAAGMNLFWHRYEMAAAGITKIELEHPGFARAFNLEFYRRITADPYLKSSRALVVDIIAAIAPTIEGLAASAWIDRQYVFDCVNHLGRKIWLRTQHYPWDEYFIFQWTQFYETFANGSDWAVPDGQGGYIYHSLNGSAGAATLRNHAGAAVWERPLLITPTQNPPQFFGFGTDLINLTTQLTHEPWPGGDGTKFVTNLLSLGLYKLTVSFAAGATLERDVHRVIGAPLRSTRGVFGGVIGGNGGTITLTHRASGTTGPVPLVDGAFWTTATWASVPNPETVSNDSVPGVVDILYVDAGGNRYGDVRTIGYGSSSGTQALLFDVSKMARLNGAPNPWMAIDTPVDRQLTGTSLTIAGWAVDLGSVSGPGVDTVHVWAFPLTAGEPTFLGVATFGQPRTDLAAVFGARFRDSGYVLTASGVPPGDWRVIAFAHSTVSNTFGDARFVDVTVGTVVSLPSMAVDAPAPDSVVSSSFSVQGWAVDRGADSGTGVDGIHVWAFPVDGSPAFFAGAGTADGARPDIGAAFGPRFTPSGYSVTVSTLPAGMYDLYVFAHSTVTGTFNQARIVRVTR